MKTISGMTEEFKKKHVINNTDLGSVNKSDYSAFGYDNHITKEGLHQKSTQTAAGPKSGVWSQSEYEKAYHELGPEAVKGQHVGQSATGFYAVKKHNYDAIASWLPQDLYDENGLIPPGGGGGDAGELPEPATYGSSGLSPGGQLGGATPGAGDHTTPPPTNSNVNNGLTNISQVMQNNSRVPGAAGASTLGGRQPTEGSTRPTTSGRANPTRKPKSSSLNLGADTTGASGKIDTIKRLGIRF